MTLRKVGEFHRLEVDEAFDEGPPPPSEWPARPNESTSRADGAAAGASGTFDELSSAAVTMICKK